MDNNDLKIVEPKTEHFEAFKKAQNAMRSYVGEDIIQQYREVPDDDKEAFKLDDTAKRESLDFSFTDPWYDNITKEQFNDNFVKFYENKRNEGAKRPQEFYFMMSGDEIVGEISARSRKMDKYDFANGVKPHKKWGNDMAVEVGMCILPDYRGGGRGYANKAKKELFNILKAQGVEEITGTVVHDNIGSHKSQEKSLKECGGYTIKVPGGTRYIFSTDTSGNSISLYDDKHGKNIDLKREARKNLGLDNINSRIDVLREKMAKMKDMTAEQRLELRMEEHKGLAAKEDEPAIKKENQTNTVRIIQNLSRKNKEY